VEVTSTAELARLELRADTALEVNAPAPDGDVRVTSDVDSGATVDIAVGEGRTTITLRCAAFATCGATVLAE
jgi:hypothetical protein